MKIIRVSKSYGKKKILNRISLNIKKGDKLAIIGPSGTGKSTLLRCINKLEEDYSGRIEYDFDIELLRKKIGFVFQEWNLWPNMTVLKNITLAPIHVLKKRKHNAEDEAMKWLNKVGLLSHMNKYPSELSGGEKQRVAIARALAMNPEILMLDEITSSLDPSKVKELLGLIEELSKEELTIIIVTHHLEFAKAVADNVAFLYNGRIQESGPAKETLENPKTKELDKFVNSLKC
jgi:ABC-type polar amino acid transport system ATPase subunit